MVGSHDHPGHGLSAGIRGLADPPGALVIQAAIQIQAFAIETGSMPFVFGHSLGGVIATELVLQHGLPVKGLVLSAPAFAPIISRVNRFQLRLLTIMAPRLCLSVKYEVNSLTHDEEIKKLALADPLMHSYKSASLINWLMQSGERSLNMAAALSVSTLLLIAGDDLVVDSAQTRQFASRASADKLTLAEYDGFYHELLNETPERRERVLVDIENWLATCDQLDHDCR